MKAVSVLEHFSDHDSIHQKLKKNTASVYSIAQLGRITIHRSAVSTFHQPGFFRHRSPLSRSDLSSSVVARSFSLSRLLFDLLPVFIAEFVGAGHQHSLVDAVAFPSYPRHARLARDLAGQESV
ncbi:hypothetical protein TNCV_444481 [Trichonephila clavipes]|nr:hypothetical protein TNCV_444481 [Trichonephila clavipes]